MKRSVFLIPLLMLLLSPAALAEREFMDMAGRMVLLPAKIEYVFGLDAAASMFLLTAAPDAIAGWNYELTEQERDYLPQHVMDLDSFGAGENIDAAALRRSGVQVLFSASALSDAEVRRAETLAGELGLPVVCLSSMLFDIPDVLMLLGSIFEVDLGRQIDFAQSVLAETEDISRNSGPSFCCISGIGSLKVLPAGAPQSAVFALAGGQNAADIPGNLPAPVGTGFLLDRRPQVIFAAADRDAGLSAAGTAAALLSDTDLRDIPAIRDGRVFAIPDLPFCLFSPDGPNRIGGILWAGNMFRPNAAAGTDPGAELLRFYRLFYHLDMNEDDMWLLLSTYNPHIVD